MKRGNFGFCAGTPEGGIFEDKVIGTFFVHQKKNGAIIPCYYLKKGTHNSVSMIKNAVRLNVQGVLHLCG